jgi:hypothetical protein
MMVLRKILGERVRKGGDGDVLSLLNSLPIACQRGQMILPPPWMTLVMLLRRSAVSRMVWRGAILGWINGASSKLSELLRKE